MYSVVRQYGHKGSSNFHMGSWSSFTHVPIKHAGRRFHWRGKHSAAVMNSQFPLARSEYRQYWCCFGDYTLTLRITSIDKTLCSTFCWVILIATMDGSQRCAGQKGSMWWPLLCIDPLFWPVCTKLLAGCNVADDQMFGDGLSITIGVSSIAAVNASFWALTVQSDWRHWVKIL